MAFSFKALSDGIKFYGAKFIVPALSVVVLFAGNTKVGRIAKTAQIGAQLVVDAQGKSDEDVVVK